MSWLDDLIFGIRTIFWTSGAMPLRSALEFKGSVTVADNPTTKRTEVTVAGGGGGGLPAGGTPGQIVRNIGSGLGEWDDENAFTAPNGLLYGSSGNTVGFAFGAPQDGKVLGVVAGALSWVTPAAAFVPPTGVMYGAGGAASGLAFGVPQNGQVLGVSAGALTWVTPTPAFVPNGVMYGDGTTPSSLFYDSLTNGKVLGVSSGVLTWVSPAVNPWTAGNLRVPYFNNLSAPATFDIGSSKAVYYDSFGSQLRVAELYGDDTNQNVRSLHKRYNRVPSSGSATSTLTLADAGRIGERDYFEFSSTADKTYLFEIRDNSCGVLEIRADFTYSGAGAVQAWYGRYQYKKIAGVLTLTAIDAMAYTGTNVSCTAAVSVSSNNLLLTLHPVAATARVDWAVEGSSMRSF